MRGFVFAFVMIAVLLLTGCAQTESKSSPTGAALSDDCDIICYREQLKAIGESQGIIAMLAELESDVATDPTVIERCHPVAHELGELGYVLKQDYGDAFVEGAPICASGYYHGVMIGYLKAHPDFTEKEFSVVCDSQTDPFLYFQCLHGLGHGTMFYYDHDVDAALKACDLLKDTYERESCYGGVFMENGLAAEGYHEGEIDPDDPEYPCNAVAEQYRSACYFLLTSQVILHHTPVMQDVAAVCADAPEQYQTFCFQSYGRDVSSQTISGSDIPRVIELCSYAGEHRRDCIIGVVRDIVNTDKSIGRAEGFCNAISQELQSDCWWAIGTMMQSLNLSEAVCEERAGAFAEQCKTGLNAYD